METKKQGSNGLHFTATKSPDDYFYFKNTYQGPSEGTRLSIHLSEETQQKLPFEVLKDRVSHYFRFIEFPISVTAGTNSFNVVKRKLDITIKENIEPRIEYRFKDKLKEAFVLQVHADDDDYEAVMGICFIKRANGDFSTPLSKFYRDQYERNIQVSQKGVFVSETEQDFVNFEGSIFIVNLKKRNAIRLDRNNLDDNQTLEACAAKLSSLLFEEFIKKCPFKSVNKKTEWFYRTSTWATGRSFTSKNNYSSRLLSIIQKADSCSAIKFRMAGNTNFWSLSQFNDSYSTAAIGSAKGLDIITGYPQVVLNSNQYNFFRHLFENRGYYPKILFIDGVEYLIWSKEGSLQQSIAYFSYLVAISFQYQGSNKNYFIGNPSNQTKFRNSPYGYFFLNLNHPLVNFLINENKERQEDPEFKILVEDFSNAIVRYSPTRIQWKELQHAILGINRLCGTNFNVIKSEIPASFEIYTGDDDE